MGEVSTEGELMGQALEPPVLRAGSPKTKMEAILLFKALLRLIAVETCVRTSGRE